ncbi:MAG: hypothetical protein CM1200mP41_34050 [Gammaproteobacteria bacterium]|nr:MAG: hypothetical protein CM1200mP41_34050 [Gammaproteobacteria bacterium]
MSGLTEAIGKFIAGSQDPGFHQTRLMLQNWELQILCLYDAGRDEPVSNCQVNGAPGKNNDRARLYSPMITQVHGTPPW